MSFDPAFRMYSVPPEHGWAMHSMAEQHAEILEELTERHRLYPVLVAKGRMTLAAMEHELKAFSCIANQVAPPSLAHPRKPEIVTWVVKLHALRREIGLRRTLYPRWILAHRITPNVAEHKLAVIEGIHDIFWSCSHPEAIAAREATEARATKAAA